MEISEEIANISRGRISLTDAISQLDLVQKAFQRSEEVKQLLENNAILIQNMQNSISHMVSQAYFKSSISEISSGLEKSLREKFDEFSSTYFSQLSCKTSAEDLDRQLLKKVGWASFNTLSQQVGSLQGRFDKHLYSEYEGFKTKMKLELASKSNESKGLDINNEEFIQLKSRLVGVEQKLEEMFMEEDALQDDDDYDSQEEMDNMLDDIDIVAKREDTGEGEIEDVESTTPELLTEPNPFKSDVSLNSEITVLEHLGAIEPEKKIEPARLEIEKPQSRQSRNQSIGGESKTMQRRNSKESSIAASRVLGGGANLKVVNKKIASMQKEIDTNRTDIEEKQNNIQRLEDELENTNNYIRNVEEKLAGMLKTLDVMEASFIRALRRNGLDKKISKKETVVAFPQKQLETIEKKIEEKFKRLVSVECEIEKIQSEISQLKKVYREKLNEIIQSLAHFESHKLASDREVQDLIDLVNKNDQVCKENFLIFSSKFLKFSEPLTDLISDQQRENKLMAGELKRNQSVFRALVNEVSGGTSNCRSQSEEGAIIGYAQKVTSNYMKKIRNTSATPDLSVKSRFYKTNYTANSPVKNDPNWFGSLPDGKAVSLPRVPARLGK